MRGLVFLFIFGANGFFNFNFNQGQEQHHEEQSYEQQVLNNDCKEFVCASTKQCVKNPVDCDCPFPQSQLKCVYPGGKSYVCISKPAVNNEKLQKVYDDPVQGPKAKNKGVRDCGWVSDVWNGKI